VDALSRNSLAVKFSLFAGQNRFPFGATALQ
jgi:hypothetical protein